MAAEIYVWDTDYKAASPSTRSLKDWIGHGPIGLVVTGTESDDDGQTKAVKVNVVESDGTVSEVKVSVVRIIRQLATLSAQGTDRTVAEVAAYGRRGYVLAPPSRKPSADLIAAVTKA